MKNCPRMDLEDIRATVGKYLESVGANHKSTSKRKAGEIDDD